MQAGWSIIFSLCGECVFFSYCLVISWLSLFFHLSYSVSSITELLPLPSPCIYTFPLPLHSAPHPLPLHSPLHMYTHTHTHTHTPIQASITTMLLCWGSKRCPTVLEALQKYQVRAVTWVLSVHVHPVHVHVEGHVHVYVFLLFDCCVCVQAWRFHLLHFFHWSRSPIILRSVPIPSSTFAYP